MTSDDRIAYRKRDLEKIQLPDDCFDLAFSSLAFHYIQNLDGIFASVHRALTSVGQFLFSTEYPLYTASRRPEWISRKDGYKSWTVHQYLVEGSRITAWLTKGVVKLLRTIGTTVDMLLRAGFVYLTLKNGDQTMINLPPARNGLSTVTGQ